MFRQYLIEFLGTFLLLGAFIQTNGDGIKIGLALAAAMVIGGTISGGHFNPAVTVAMFSNGSTTAKEALAYVGLQLAGALAAIYFFTNDSIKNQL
jgi:aquaporin Z